jgi:hypothetical protein
MTVSRFQMMKSETRDLADLDRLSSSGLGLGDPTEWEMSNQTFFKVFVVITALLAVTALILR